VTAFRVVQPWPFDAQTKDEAAAVLAAMGLTESDAFRLMMVRIAKEKALPFEPLIPNAKTIASIKEARPVAPPSRQPKGLPQVPQCGRLIAPRASNATTGASGRAGVGASSTIF
jgi:DNA-damage-inducible protein J